MEKLKGTGVAIVTPFDKNKSVDFKALEKVIDHIISGGVQYIVTLGTTGETPVLSKEEKIDIINFTFEYVNNRVPIVVGIGGNDTRSLLNDLNTFPIEKAIAILSASPYYNKPSQEGLFQHYKLIAENSPKPILLYNVPARTGRNMEASTTLRLSREVRNIVGIKEAGGNMIQCMELLKERPDGFIVVSGDDDLVLPQMACGMDGVISVVANAIPKPFTKMINHCIDGDYKMAKTINDSLIPAYQLMFAENNPAGVKGFLTEMGLIENELRLPLVSLSLPIQQGIKSYLQKNNF
ncbi:MAG: 4-hydroxy-tetrahydrodipicolinate synthase [Sphingobacteriales bacterium]|nr:4-hydroxy-tetrahydrodipicolinate synthase [Sphingobacteriales bacterium]